jgi:Domain of unknown function (DUF5659)
MHTEYKTPDIVLAAYLKLSGCAMLRIDKQGQKGTFVFENVSEEVIRTFDFGQARVEPVSFNNMIKQLTTSVRRMD